MTHASNAVEKIRAGMALVPELKDAVQQSFGGIAISTAEARTIIAALSAAQELLDTPAVGGGVVPRWVKNHFAERLEWAEGDGMDTIDVNTEAVREILETATFAALPVTASVDEVKK